MKKYLALLAAVLVFAFAGMAFAADTNAPTSGHGGSQPVADPDSGNTGSAGATEVTEVVVETKAPVQVVVVAAAVATVASAEDVKVTVVQAVLNAISNAISSILEALGITGGSTEVKGADNIEVNEEEAYASDEEAMEQSAARLENNGVTGQTAVAALPRGMAVKESGTQPVSLPKFKKEMYGKRPQMNMFPRGRARNAEFAAAADGDGDAVFLDSTGAQVNVIPGEDNANGAEPGQLTAVVYMEAGETYDPVISVPTEEITSDTALANQVTTKAVAEEVITTQTFMATSTFSTFVPSALLEGTNYVTIPADAVSAAGWEDTAAEKAYKEADASFDVYTVAALPAIAAPAAPTWYIAAVSFDRGTKTASDLYTGAALEFFPSNVMGEPDTNARFFKESNGSLTALTAAEVFGASSRYTQGYVAFQLSAAATKPAIATDVKKASSNSGNGGNTGGNTGGDTPTPTPTDSDPGSSGGGCSAGFSALALAVLGGFIAARKK